MFPNDLRLCYLGQSAHKRIHLQTSTPMVDSPLVNATKPIVPVTALEKQSTQLYPFANIVNP